MKEYDDSKRTLVTGGAGFLGSHLIERLLERGDEVLCVDNFFTGTKRNIVKLYDHPRFEFVRHDITFRCMWRQTRSGILRVRFSYPLSA